MGNIKNHKKNGHSQIQHPDRRLQKKQENKKKTKRHALIISAEVLVLLILLGAGYVMQKYDKFQTTDIAASDITVNEGAVKEGYTTIALFGGDSREGALEAGAHTDCIILASINNETKEVKLASVYRDTLTRQVDGTLNKVNYAYFKGGPKDAINVLNTNMDLDIQNYATVDFKALVDAIDLLGGIEIDIQDVEVEYMNEFLQETADVAGVKAHKITEAGLQTLDGAQAVTYARIRSTKGGDYKRTERQRTVLMKMFEKATASDLGTLNKIIDATFPQVSTSFTLKELISLASSATKYKLTETTGFPLETGNARISGIGSATVALGMAENVEELHKILYPDEEYTISDTVKEIGVEVANDSGLTRSDYEEGNMNESAY